ncbi:MAG: hypothetical protein ACE5ED_04480 [Rhodothalassiaceae bacterium]
MTEPEGLQLRRNPCRGERRPRARAKAVLALARAAPAVEDLEIVIEGMEGMKGLDAGRDAEARRRRLPQDLDLAVGDMIGRTVRRTVLEGLEILRVHVLMNGRDGTQPRRAAERPERACIPRSSACMRA